MGQTDFNGEGSNTGTGGTFLSFVIAKHLCSSPAVMGDRQRKWTSEVSKVHLETVQGRENNSEIETFLLSLFFSQKGYK